MLTPPAQDEAAERQRHDCHSDERSRQQRAKAPSAREPDSVNECWPAGRGRR